MNSETELYTPDYREAPYWWDGAPPPAARDAKLPARADVVVIGAGYTGLSAALQTARGGRLTVVLDTEAAGWGCSSRNGGQVSTSIKPYYEELVRHYGPEAALAIRREGMAALDYLDDFIRAEAIDCDWGRVGRFHAAHTAKHYEKLMRGLAAQPKGTIAEWHAVPRAEQWTEIGTDAYYGGVILPRHGALHPARYHAGLLAQVKAAGAVIIDRCKALTITRETGGFKVETARGWIATRDVVIATNGYTSTLTPWLRRRVIPIGSYIIATEPLSLDLARSLVPKGRVVSDTRKVVYYYRLSPDGRRMVFGGQVASVGTNPRSSAPRLHAAMSNLFPELASARISHSWLGFVAYTFDELPHLGVVNGMHYAMGYCGSGVSLASYFGMRIGQRVLGAAEGLTALDDLSFQTRPLYTGNPWFLGAAVAYYQLRDCLDL
jgi:glycine/D-amino acid oxidase-like deaminating enzyme